MSDSGLPARGKRIQFILGHACWILPLVALEQAFVSGNARSALLLGVVWLVVLWVSPELEWIKNKSVRLRANWPWNRISKLEQELRDITADMKSTIQGLEKKLGESERENAELKTRLIAPVPKPLEMPSPPPDSTAGAFATLFDLANRTPTPEQKIKGLEHEIEELKKSLEKAREGRDEMLRAKFAAKFELAGTRLFWIGCEPPVSRNLRVRIRFIDPNDAKLAQDIRKWFFASHNPPWTVVIEQIQWEESPTMVARILVVSTDPKLAQTLSDIFNGCKLIGDESVAWSEGMMGITDNVEVVFTIYMKQGK